MHYWLCKILFELYDCVLCKLTLRWALVRLAIAQQSRLWEDVGAFAAPCSSPPGAFTSAPLVHLVMSTSYKCEWEEERKRRRELKISCEQLTDRILILEARLAVAERQASSSPYKSPRKLGPREAGGEANEEATDAEIDPIEESIRRLYVRNQYLEDKIKQLETSAATKSSSSSSPPAVAARRPDFKEKSRVSRRMLQVQEEIETTLIAEVNRLRHVVRTHCRAIQGLVTSPGATLDSEEYAVLHDSRGNATSFSAWPSPSQTQPSRLRQMHAAQHNSAGAGGRSHAARTVRNAAGKSGGRANRSKLSARSVRGLSTSIFGPRDQARGLHEAQVEDVFLDISDEDDEDDDHEDAPRQSYIGRTLPNVGAKSSSSSSSGAGVGSPTCSASNAHIRSSGSPRSNSSSSSSSNSSQQANSSRSGGLGGARPWSPTKAKEIIPNIADHGMLNMSPVHVDPNYENRLHAAALESFESAARAGASSTPTRISRVPIPPAKPSSPSPSSSPQLYVCKKKSSASKAHQSPGQRQATPPPASKSNRSSHISQALQKEVEKILLEIEASLKD